MITRKKILGVLLVVGGIGLLVSTALLIPAIRGARRAADHSSCHGTMSVMWVNLRDHLDGAGAFPAGILNTDQGQTTWRTAISDYTVFATEKPNSFRCRAFEDSTCSCFVVIVGEETAFPVDRGVSQTDMTDGPENTILFFEADNRHLQSCEKVDWLYDELQAHLDEHGMLQPVFANSNQHARGLVFADGQIYRQRKPISLPTLRALATISGGEPVTRDQLEAQGVIEYLGGR